jgi:two-component system, cell cycle response regulator
VHSFKTKLAFYFLLFSLLPIAAAFWGFSKVASESEVRRADTRLEGALRAAFVGYQRTLDRRQSVAQRLAQDPTFERALERRDRREIARMLQPLRHVHVSLANGANFGPTLPQLAALRTVAVYTRNGSIGTVTAFVPFDGSLARSLRKASGLGDGDAVVVVDRGRIIGAAPALQGSLSARAGVASSRKVGDTHYRVVASAAIDDAHRVRLAVLTPQRTIDSASFSTQERLLLFFVLVLLAVAGVAYVEGWTIVRRLRGLVAAARALAQGRLEDRAPVHGRDEFAELGHAFNDMADQLQARLAELQSERERLREVFARFGDALSATHDPDQLLRVILDATVEATVAQGAALIDDRGGLIQVGELDRGRDRLELPLSAGPSSFGTLVLVGDAFGADERLTAASLAAHAVVALENARLHRIVERQALVDGLTGLANRRHCEEALKAELSRARRFGTPLTAVLADLDDFKDINDDYGHATGDVVLREFAAVLRENLRDADVAGRWGGEEFLVLLPGTDADGGTRLAERIRLALEERTILSGDGAPVLVTCSVGVATLPPAPDVESLVAWADAALYRAKRGGKNRVEVAEARVRRP